MAQVEELLQSKEFRRFLESLVAETVSRFVQTNEQRARELALMDRVVRVEEELKALRKLEAERFEVLYREMTARFEAIDQRFEALERRFTFTQWLIAGGFGFVSFLITLLQLLFR